jgi:hypothetical protein
MTNYPTSIDTGTSLPTPSATDDTNSPSLAGLNGSQNDILLALENKLGIAASTPTAGMLLRSTTDGESTWDLAYPASAIVGISDTQTLTNKLIDFSKNTVSNVSGADISSQSITATQIANATLTLAQIASSAIDVATGSYFYIGTTLIQYASTTVDIAVTGTAYSWTIDWPKTFNSISFGFQSVLGDNSQSRDGDGTFELISTTQMTGFVTSNNGTYTVTIYALGIGT